MPASAQAADLHFKKEDLGAYFWTFPFFDKTIIVFVKTATTIDEQIAKLKERGMQIADEVKAKEILLDIGYYRLGFYWFPFEKGYPKKYSRKHRFIKEANFENAVSLYYFDNDLRNTLAPFLHRIEICFRTAIIYIVSNHYKRNPTWFVDTKILNEEFVSKFPDLYKEIRKNEAVKCHHKKYRNDIYAPAWKTLEYMTFGGMLFLYQNLKSEELRQQIADKFGISNLEAFESQMKTIRIIRNVCAHGHNLYDIHFPQSIKVGELKGLSNKQRNNISGGLIIIENILKTISENRRKEYCEKIQNLIISPQFANIRSIITYITLKPMKVLPTNAGF